MKAISTLFLSMTSGILLLSFIYFQQEKENRKYFKPEFNAGNVNCIQPRFIHFDDTIPNDSIYICFAANKFPYAYYREIFTNVCSEELCLPVSLLIYWSPGGDFLGYTIKNNEIFTKLDHIPFKEEDYLRLHNLLDDPQSILRNYKMRDLVSNNPDSSREVDGITSATILDVESYVVKGAVYTTYVLWHTVYGSSLDSIREISLEYLSIPFLETLIISPHKDDNFFALDILKKFDLDVTETILLGLEEFLASDDYVLKQNSIDALISSGISDSLIQTTLMNVYHEMDYGTKLRILRILNNLSYLFPDTIEELIDHLSMQSGVIIMKILNLLQSQAELHISYNLKIAELLEHENRFIAKIAYDYLSSFDNNEEILIMKIQEYEGKFHLN